jgi:hypothetical protein
MKENFFFTESSLSRGEAEASLSRASNAGRRARRPMLLLVTCCWLATATAGRAAAADDVVLLISADGRSQYHVQGEVLEYTGTELVLRRAAGREERYAAERVLEVQGAWSEPQRASNQRRTQARGSL